MRNLGIYLKQYPVPQIWFKYSHWNASNLIFSLFTNLSFDSACGVLSWLDSPPSAKCEGSVRSLQPLPCLVWLGGLSVDLWTKRLVGLISGHAWALGQVPTNSRGSWTNRTDERGNQSMYLSSIDVPLIHFLPPFPSVSKNKQINH